jgi:hypothetical protein
LLVADQLDATIRHPRQQGLFVGHARIEIHRLFGGEIRKPQILQLLRRANTRHSTKQRRITTPWRKHREQPPVTNAKLGTVDGLRGLQRDLFDGASEACGTRAHLHTARGWGFIRWRDVDVLYATRQPRLIACKVGIARR